VTGASTSERARDGDADRAMDLRWHT